jgi:hypothetical protein
MLKIRKTAPLEAVIPQPIVSNALPDNNMLRLRCLILPVHLDSSMQFLVCRKLLSHKGLWRVLSSSVASVKAA